MKYLLILIIIFARDILRSSYSKIETNFFAAKIFGLV